MFVHTFLYILHFFPLLVVLTSIPSNDAELQLYRVMQRASLLAYYDTLLEMGTCMHSLKRSTNIPNSIFLMKRR